MPIPCLRLPVAAALCWLAAGAALACSVHGPQPQSRVKIDAAAQVAVGAGWNVTPAASGSWFAPDRSGEGIVLELLDDGSAIAFWFTFSPDGEQAWLLAADGDVDGDVIRFQTVFRPQGARFGAQFDSNDVAYAPWGTLELHLHGCGELSLGWQGPPEWGSGERLLTRLTTIDELDCNGQRKLLPNGARALSGLQSKSGAWYVEARSGEGWILEQLPDGRAGVYWFTFDPQGRQAWMIGISEQQGSRIEFDTLLIGSGTRFGDAFDAGAVQLEPWGRLSLDFAHCNAVAVDYAADDAGWGSATRAAVRLTTLASAPCIDAVPPVAGASWIERTKMPVPHQSEHPATALDGFAYTLGGFGGPRSFKRFDPATSQWSVLPDLPAGRDHAAAFAIAGGVYYTGGATNGPGDQSTSGFRYDVASNSWQPRPELPHIFGSHAAVLNGRAYIGDQEGSLFEYDPRHRRVRRIPTFGGFAAARDHSQVVAFMGEIWMLGGRAPETNGVVIYDPVAARWRNGPSMPHARGGFGATVAGHRIVAAGGEIITGGLLIMAETDLYAAGDSAWRLGPPMPVALHGNPAATVNGRVFVLGGSTLAGGIANPGRVFELLLP